MKLTWLLKITKICLKIEYFQKLGISHCSYLVLITIVTSYSQKSRNKIVRFRQTRQKWPLKIHLKVYSTFLVFLLLFRLEAHYCLCELVHVSGVAVSV